jgi:anti-sigma-K factor RskA
MSMERHEDIQAQLADYVLGELATEARRRVDAHVATCEDCATEVRELGLAFQGIGLAEEPVAPPPHLRARVLGSIEQDARMASRQSPVLAPSRADGFPGAWLALAATVALILGAALFLNVRRNGELLDAVRSANAVTAELQQRIGDNQAQADLAVSILTAPDMRRIDLAGFDSSRDAVARAYWSGAKGLLIVADRLPPPPPGRVYQVWLIGSASAGPVSAGLLDDSSSGRGMLIVPAPQGVAGTVTVAVTDEPPGGLSAPTGGKHLAGS